MRSIVLAGLTALALAGCTVTAQQAQDWTDAGLSAICTALGPTDQVFQQYAATHAVNGTITKSETIAVRTVASICDSWATAQATGKPFDQAAAIAAARKAMAALTKASIDAGVF